MGVVRGVQLMPLGEVIDLSINETLSRTILTGVTAIAGITALLIFGGEVLRNFSVAMLFGSIIGLLMGVGSLIANKGTRFPFGPALALGALMAIWLYQPVISHMGS